MKERPSLFFFLRTNDLYRKMTDISNIFGSATNKFFHQMEILLDGIEDHDSAKVKTADISQLIIDNTQFLEMAEAREQPLSATYIKSHNNLRNRALAYRVFGSPAHEPADTEKTWKERDDSTWEILQFQQILLNNPKFSANYEFVNTDKGNPFLGRGREGIVFKARDKATEMLMAIKVDCSRSEDNAYNGNEEVEHTRWFEMATHYPSYAAKNYPPEPGVQTPGFNAKRFVEGDTLEAMMENGEIFDNEKLLSKLEELLKALVAARLFFGDIAPENFVYDKETELFYIIDLRPAWRLHEDPIELTVEKYTTTMFTGEIAWNNKDQTWAENVSDDRLSPFIERMKQAVSSIGS